MDRPLALENYFSVTRAAHPPPRCFALGSAQTVNQGSLAVDVLSDRLLPITISSNAIEPFLQREENKK